MTPEYALAETWAAIDGKRDKFDTDDDYKDGYLSDASAIIEGLKKRGFKIVAVE